MDLRDVATDTGWRIEHRTVTGSTNDDARELRSAGAQARTVVMADQQSAGRGRNGRVFLSPSGGLYVSLLIEAPAAARPAGIVALAALATCEAIESIPGMPWVGAPQIKWPNDIWIDRKKVAGILVEAAVDDPVVVVGIGINVAGVPDGLEPDVRVRAIALACTAEGLVAVPRRVPLRLLLLRNLLMRADWLQRTLVGPGGIAALEGLWSARLAMIGEPVSFHYAGEPMEGVLEAASLEQGLLVRDPRSGPVWRASALVQDLTPREP